jgi:hypothetical protein
MAWHYAHLFETSDAGVVIGIAYRAPYGSYLFQPVRAKEGLFQSVVD